MTFAIGRVELDLDSRAIRMDEDSLSISGDITADTVAELIAKRDQMRGLAEPGAPLIVPVTWDLDPSLNGYYQLKGVSVEQDPMTYVESGAASIGWCGYNIGLERMPGGNALPVIESILQGGYRPNEIYSNVTHAEGSFTAGIDLLPEWHVPLTSLELDPRISSYFATLTGSIRVMGYPSGYFTRVGRWSVPAANFYDAACLIESDVDGTWMPVVGRQLVVTDPTKVRISNSYMGVTFGGASDMGVRFYTPGFAATFGPFMRVSSNGSVVAASTVQAVTVLRNDPEEVRLRFSLLKGTAIWTPYTIDLSLRRGLDYITVVASSSDGSSYAPGVWINAPTGVACTATSAGIFQTTASGGAQPWALCASTSTVNSTPASGKMFPDNGNYLATGLGPVWNAYSADTFPGGTAVRWFAPVNETQRFVGR